MAPNGSIDGALRAAVRKELEWEGFAMLAPGLLAHPAADPRPGRHPRAHQRHRQGLRLQRRRAAGPVRGRWANWCAKAGTCPAWWPSYRRFIAEFTPLLATLREEPGDGAARRVRVRSLLIHAYRRVQLHDPMLPLELLPQPWPGSEAYALAQAIYLLGKGRAAPMDAGEDADAHRGGCGATTGARTPSAPDAFERRSRSSPGPVQAGIAEAFDPAQLATVACSNQGNMANGRYSSSRRQRSQKPWRRCW
jgi:hypothetical protein